MPEIVNCPQCQRQLRVPDELLGKPVRCPSCNTMFTASTGSAGTPRPAESPVGEPAAASPAPVGVDPARSQVDWEPGYEGVQHPGSREQALRRLRGPAICLLVTGILGVLLYALLLVRFMTADPKALAEEAAARQEPANRQAVIDMTYSIVGRPGRIGVCIFLAISVIVTLAAMCMLTGRFYLLAVAGSALAIVDVCCCVGGVPFGIWSLVVLMDSQVRAAFR